MARNQGPMMPEDDATSPTRAGSEREDGAFVRGRRGAASTSQDLEPQYIDLNDEDEQQEEQQFRRAPKRVSVRRGAVTKKTANRLKIALIAAVVLGTVGGVTFAVQRYGATSWRFRVESSDNIEIEGNKHVTRAQVMEIFGGDISRNIFSVSLEERKRKLEQIPWVESASVMRFLPNRLKVVLRERTPVAFVQQGTEVELIDASGVIMDMPVGATYSFPVILGMGENEALSTRAARMKIYSQLVKELDSGGSYSKDLNEVDLSDPEDVKVTVADPNGSVLLHLGSSGFFNRYKIFVTHVQEWRQQYPSLESVDLRYDRQVVLNPDSRAASSEAGAKPAPAATPSAPVAHKRAHRRR